MPEVIMQNQLLLSKQDLALIKKIATECGIRIFKGPETAALFATRDDPKPYQSIPTMGTWAQSRAPTNELPESKKYRRIERMFIRSQRWPEGIPLGWFDVHKRKDRNTDEYKLESSLMDISNEEFARLRSMSEFEKRMTRAERDADAQRKQRLRAAQAEPEMDASMARMFKAFGMAAMKLEEEEKSRTREAAETK